MSEPLPAHVTTWLTEPLTVDVADAIRATAVWPDVQFLAVMPDVHLAGDVCNGVVVATNELIYPSAVGSDIGCGMLAVALNLSAECLETAEQASRLLAALYAKIPAIKHRHRGALPELPSHLLQSPLSAPALSGQRPRDGHWQFGTLGRGNHFLEFQRDDDQRLWLMIHSGSRAMGQFITRHHCRDSNDSKGPLAWTATSTEGRNYLADVDWAVEYARQNRLCLAQGVERVVAEHFNASVDWSTVIETNHNHVRHESHRGQLWWIHRKGAMPASPGQPGLIPGSMGTASYHVTGRGCERALRSSSHGAGRRWTRTAARQRISIKDLSRQLDRIWFDHRSADSLREEAPEVYRDIERVMRAQRELIRIDRRMIPVLSYKG